MAVDPLTAGLNVGNSILDIVKGYFPGKLSPDQEADIAQRGDAAFRSFVVQYEGAAKDYKDIPIIGPIVLLFRGLIRPVITCLVGYLDFDYLTSIGTNYTVEQAGLLKAMTIIVFMFWFGERLVKNTGLVEAIGNFFKSKL